ncbi:hypothetical protein JJQ60_20780 [Aquimarina mytili]|uniref:Galactose oxidase n=2 Tax=Aquimarina mytili TaxID=874423 RepID=A0A937DAG1_9FLAO|nr:hypothetical protein [Aquimarina mytili]
MAYNSKDANVYLFGGASEKEVLSDLWIWNSINWEKIIVEDGPEPRTFSSMIYDKANHRLVLFGGSKVLFGKNPDLKNLLNDTWEFRNNHWKKLTPRNAPSPRAESAMVYDENHQTIVLFGGYKIQDDEYIKLGDTWEFRNDEWHLVSTEGPSERHGVSMAYDTNNESVILFGGSTIDKQYGESKGETWKWNGAQWNKLEIKQPHGIFNSNMVYDKELKKLIRFGGWNGESRVNETWSLDNNTWNILKIDHKPTSRNHSNMVFDKKRKKIILFGGHDGKNIFGDTWEFVNHKWKKISEVDPIVRIQNEH